MKKKVTKEMIRLVQTRLASAGGKARAAKYDHATLSEWGKRGGRPKKRVVTNEANYENHQGSEEGARRV